MQEHGDIARPGVVFKQDTGKLYVYERASILILKAWPPMAWKKTRSKPRQWRHIRPSISIPHPDIDIPTRIHLLESPVGEGGQRIFPFALPWQAEICHRDELAWLRWYRQIPVEVLKVVARFPKRQWHLLSLIARCGPPAYDLAIMNPALTFALASSWVFRAAPVQRPMRSTRALLRPGKKQTDILKWLGFPGTPAARKLLRKVIHEAIDVASLLYIRDCLPRSGMPTAMAHLQRLNAGVLRIVTDSALLPFAAPTLLEEVSYRRSEDRRPNTARVLQDTINIWQLLFGDRRILQPIREVVRLNALHDSLIDQLNRVEISTLDASIPRPPVAGTDTIVPITTAQDLVEESRVQHNCVATHLPRIAAKQEYVYRVLEPERCTLALKRSGPNWVLAELSGPCNRSPSPAAYSVIRKWLARDAALRTPMLTRTHRDDVPF